MHLKLIPIVLITAFVAAAVGCATVDAYTGYSSAFKKTNQITSTEYKTSVKVTIDGQTTTATGNFKLRDVATNVNFINEMTIDGQTAVQFCDGQYIYIDSGNEKIKFAIGDQPESTQKERGDFSMNSYVSEFFMLLDASKIKDVKIVEMVTQNIVQKITKTNVSGGTEYDLTLAPQLVDEIFASALNEQLGEANAPTCTLKSFTYKAVANKDNYLTSITYIIDMDAVFPKELTNESADSTKSIQLEMRLDYVNPGQAAEFSLPDTSGF